MRREVNPKAIRAQIRVRPTPRVKDREDRLQEDHEATPTSPMTACVSECFPDTHARDFIDRWSAIDWLKGRVADEAGYDPIWLHSILHFTDFSDFSSFRV